jgi:hypothetical protein
MLKFQLDTTPRDSLRFAVGAALMATWTATLLSYEQELAVLM